MAQLLGEATNCTSLMSIGKSATTKSIKILEDKKVVLKLY